MNYSAIKKNDIANGPGVRVSLFVSGCRRHCKNCFNPETWNFYNGNPFDKNVMDELMRALDREYIAGFTILGGEPFEEENKGTVYHIIRTIRGKFPDKSIWCYSGFTFEELKETSINILEMLDVLVDGPFVEEKKNLRLRFRGSENQRLIDMKKTLATGSVVELESEEV
ncbi:MAG: anaerobic ribonucleoside-triphosphate reductase activating protein [Oscillospiraceae bacterium]|nr:anaerobic ribonucleoside-triphosphate reductase activating protein [Oscillospiraceae bacterium]